MTQNLRLTLAAGFGGEGAHAFADWLLRLGSGFLQTPNHAQVSIEHVKVVMTVPFDTFHVNVVDWVYTEFNNVVSSRDWHVIQAYYSDCCLITPLNKTVKDINSRMLNPLQGEAQLSISIDEPENNFFDPISHKVLNSFDFPGFPEHMLRLKTGQPLTLIRNLNVSNGLCNGTQLVLL